MAIQHDVNAKYEDKRGKNGGSGFQNRVGIGFLYRLLFSFFLCFCVLPEKNHNTGGSDKEYMGLTQCIKGTVI